MVGLTGHTVLYKNPKTHTNCTHAACAKKLNQLFSDGENFMGG